VKSNLPPGVTENMIPGNRVEDMEWERFWDNVDNDCSDMELAPAEAQAIWILGLVAYRNALEEK